MKCSVKSPENTALYRVDTQSAVVKEVEGKAAPGTSSGYANMFRDLPAHYSDTDASDWRLLLLRSSLPWSIVRIKLINIGKFLARRPGIFRQCMSVSSTDQY